MAVTTSSRHQTPIVEPERKSALYLRELRPWLPDRELRIIMRAYKLSKYGHRDQARESGERYFEHPKAVSIIIFRELKVYDSQSLIMALLHDVIEDSYLLDEELMEIIFGRVVTNGVRILSKDEESKPIYYTRLKGCGLWRVILVKLCDRLHNMRTLAGSSREKQQKQAEETRTHFFELCDILEKLLPKKYKAIVPYIREKLDALCRQYE